MRAVVLIEWGPKRWHKAVIEPGQRLVIGRHESAGLVVPHDEQMSGRHVELSWDGSRCAMRDLGSLGGTQLNGERVAAGEIAHGEWIQAGATVFSIYHEGVVTPWQRPAGAPPLSAARNVEILSALRAEKSPLYAVLDAARRSRILALLRASAAPVRSLYDGIEGEDLDDVAPHLVSLSGDAWLLERLVEEGWGDGWGVYLTSRRPFVEVRRHLRRLLLVEVKETGQKLYFRFYDPRPLRGALAAANPRQRQDIFGEIDAFLLEGPDASVEVRRRESG